MTLMVQFLKYYSFGRPVGLISLQFSSSCRFCGMLTSRRDESNLGILNPSVQPDPTLRPSSSFLARYRGPQLKSRTYVILGRQSNSSKFQLSARQRREIERLERRDVLVCGLSCVVSLTNLKHSLGRENPPLIKTTIPLSTACGLLEKIRQKFGSLKKKQIQFNLREFEEL